MNQFRFAIHTLRLAAIVPMLLLTLGAAAVAAQHETPTPGVIGTPVPADACPTSPTEVPTTVGDVTVATTYAIVSEESEARYRAQEELAGRGAAEAVGKTQAFIGNILFDESGTPLSCSRFDVDLRTLTSDEARRDNYLYGNTLETQTYPLATFILSEVQGLDVPLKADEETTFTLVGNLTFHGVTKLVSWDTTATLDGDKLEGAATTTFKMQDFAITPPIVGAVLSIDETITLEVDIVASQAEG